MIYNTITNEINDYLGGDYDIRYSNNHDVKWDEVLKEAQPLMKYGILRVDSGITTQVGDQQVRVEQIRLTIAIPEERQIFDTAVSQLKGMIYGLNKYTCADSEDNITAVLYFGEYQDANGVVVNGVKWWIANVAFTANFYDGVIDSNDCEILIDGSELNGIMHAHYSLSKTVDGNVYNGSNGIQKNSVNGIQQTITVDCIYLKNDTLIHDGTNNNGIIDVETSLTKTYTISYNNGIKTRTLSNMMLSSLDEDVLVGDILKATFVFTKGE